VAAEASKPDGAVLAADWIDSSPFVVTADDDQAVATALVTYRL
jgi:hypothetical protein